ncbi:hypothetical protein [Haliscomenobacter hydrossis]|uniref:Squalene cyclase C-terminal domain-containing protein n=1 Tax=Haliscomenobacter hydrossis (strain ATCC 27775 / DSM 1100 / LMG 10767 / O) TaxID=760192 RepID=F4KQJ0_HALH1|nr:hypothetical protein [Haliscomenobacter hydrossis]AEE49979.1 hypothetical protein Halhy_2094 [Haliscomenobacter hydrossis DSM 1100]
MYNWLLEGDVAIQFQVQRDLCGELNLDLQRRIKTEGWGRAFLEKRNPNGGWGQDYYQPKWISTHYTLLDLKNLQIEPEVPEIRQTIERVLRTEKGPDGGILPIGSTRRSDVCVNGMFLNFACYFGAAEPDLQSIVDFLLEQRVADGGFNCRSNRQGCVHSSLHSTISVLEGILEYQQNGYTYRLPELLAAAATSQEFILLHRLFKSDKTGAVIDHKMTMLSWPSRWKYDILRALDYFQKANLPYDPKMEDALQQLRSKRKADGKWPLQARHPGQVHFEMEKPGQPSRWNTLRALRVLRAYKY